ncbi:MAG TPA: peptidase, partial [Gammaproteobacteria bacterium]|nr:peptidase [Gammaproteobacteria bacterium]
NYGDENGYVSLYRAGSDRVALVGQAIHYKLSTGALLYEEPANSAVESIAEFLTGLHLQHFEHWMLRWLYVIGGLMGCACIATGFIFFIQKRAKKHAQVNTSGAAIVDALAVVMVPGMVLASVAMLLANRLLAADLPFKGDFEKYVFCGAWLHSFVHAVWRSKINSTLELNPAWREQCFAAAFIALMAVLANWVTTGDHLIQTLFVEPYYAVAGVDAMLVLTSVVGFLVAQRLRVVGTEKQKLEQGRFVYE